ncbi:MAG: HEPN domain-containing protein [Oscillospiraceae bacterium]|nr:HEPN domain-containing protein [Oscillospiraceae bacterium]
MNKQEKYEYWLDSAEYDMETAKAMDASGRWLYVVFMCQQAIEKLVKGLYTLYADDNVPKTHNITFLIREFENKLPVAVTEEQYDLFIKLRAFYINGRYTDFKRKMSVAVNEKEAKTILQQTKEAFAWLQTLKL